MFVFVEKLCKMSLFFIGVCVCVGGGGGGGGSKMDY